MAARAKLDVFGQTAVLNDDGWTHPDALVEHELNAVASPHSDDMPPHCDPILWAFETAKALFDAEAIQEPDDSDDDREF